MSKKIGVLLCAFVVFVGVLSNSFVSNAYGESSAMDFYVKYSEPTTNEFSGYISVAYLNNGTYRMYTYFWLFTPVGDSNNSINPAHHMFVTIDSNKLTFQPYCTSAGGCDVVLCCYDWQDNLRVLDVVYVPTGTQTYEIYSDNYSSTPIHGYTVGGNAHISQYSGLQQVSVPIIHWNESVDASQLDEQLSQVISALNNVDYDTSYIISQLQNIYNQNVSIQQKLDNMNSLLNQIKAEQKESNTWLEKIFNFLEEKDEKDKEAATQQGNQSSKDVSDMIQDESSEGFKDSLGGLTASMSYSGTDCSWSFPTVKLPSIPGVMDEVTLIQEQNIDFSYWVNSLPSFILLLVQSVCTAALIVFCFKELYGAISYVLTLKGGGNSE